MLKDKTALPLYQLITCGESINYLTFEIDLYQKYVAGVQK